jgi:hypothetical protein
MKNLLLSPDLFAGTGHERALLEELALELRGRPGVQLVCAVASTVDVDALAPLPCALRPVFRLHGYAKFEAEPGGHRTAADILPAGWEALCAQWAARGCR